MARTIRTVVNMGEEYPTDDTGNRRCHHCQRPISWHPIGRSWIHEELRHCWCDPNAQGYDRDRAAPGPGLERVG